MAGKSYIKVGTYDWDRIKKMYIKTGGQTWTAIRKAYVKTSTGWRKVFDTASNRPFIAGNDIPKIRLNTFRTGSSYNPTGTLDDPVDPVVEAPPVQQMGPSWTSPTLGWPYESLGRHLWGYDGTWTSGNGSSMTFTYTWLYNLTGNSNDNTAELNATSTTGRTDMLTNLSSHLGQSDGDYFDKNFLTFRVTATNSAGNASAESAPVYIVREVPTGSITMVSPGTATTNSTMSASFTYSNNWYNKTNVSNSYVEWFAVDNLGDSLTNSNRVQIEYLSSIAVTGTTSKSGTTFHVPTIGNKYYYVRMTLNNSGTENAVISITGFTPKSSVTSQANKTAKTAAQSYNVTWNGNGGSTGNEGTPWSFTAGGSVTVPSVSRIGYTFLRWTDTSSGDYTYTTTGGTFFPPSQNITMYARWQVNVCTIPDVIGMTESAAATAVNNAGFLYEFTDYIDTTDISLNGRVAAIDPPVGSQPGCGTNITLTIYNYVAKLATPTGVNATDTRTDGVNVTWNAVSGAAYYGVWYGPEPSYNSLADFGGNRNTSLITGTSYLDTSIGSGVTRNYYVQAYKSGDPTGTKSEWGGPDSGTRAAVVSIPSGGSVSLTGGSTAGSIITASTSGWSGSPTSYDVYITTALSPNIPTSSSSRVASSGGGSSTSYTITSSDAISPVNIFRAFATASNSAGTSGTVQSSNTIITTSSSPATSPGTPGTPTNGWTGGTSYPFSWTAPGAGTVSGGGAATITGYTMRIYEATSSSGTGSYILTTLSLGSGTSYTYTSPNASLYYAASVAATNSAGLTGPYSGISQYK
jgi:hypothetical protein